MDMHKQLQLRQERNHNIYAAREILDRATVENRALSRREKAEVEELQSGIDAIDNELRRAGVEFDPRTAQGTGYGSSDGRSDVVLRSDQRVSEWLERRGYSQRSDFSANDQISFGKYIRGAVTGNWQGAEAERRALVEGTNSAGGFLTPEPLAAQFIDRVRNAARVMQAGAHTVPMTSDTLNLARLTGGATVAWKNEGNPISASDMVFDRVTFTARTLPILVVMSRELFEDMTPESASGIENEMAQALSLELDRVCLRGTGVAPEPKGIRNTSGVTIQSLGANGATPTFDNVVDGVSNVRGLNIEPNALIWSSRTSQTFGKLKESTGAYLQPPPAIDTVRRLVSNQIPNNLTVGGSGDCSEIYVGDWSQLLVGIRTDLRFQVQVLDQRFADNLQVGLLTYLRADVQLQHPEAFNVITGVRP